MFTKLERERSRGSTEIAGELLGRPSVVFTEGEFEYQVANPFIQGLTRWQEKNDGTPEMLSQLRVLEFAMIPREELPEIADNPV